MLDRNSPTWLSLKRAITSRIEKLRDDLEQPGMESEGLRGQIASLRWVIATVEPVAPIAGTGTDYFAPDISPDADPT